MAEFTTDHVRERFYNAARTLATMEGSLRKRVETAASIVMVFGSHDTARLPEEMREEFERLRQLYPENVTSDNAQTLAQEIFDFYVRTRGGI